MAKQETEGLFEGEIGRAIEMIKPGNGVRIIGAAGSGKSTVIAELVTRLERFGHTPRVINALRTQRNIPLAAIDALELATRPGRTRVVHLANALSAQLAAQHQPVIMIDDIQYVDQHSLAVLEDVLRRTDCPLVTSAPASTPLGQDHLALLARRSEAVIRLHPLSDSETSSLARRTLGNPLTRAAAARLVSASEGNPKLVVRIVQAAVLAGQLSLNGKEWKMTSDSLSNEHMAGTLEEMQSELSPEQVVALLPKPDTAPTANPAGVRLTPREVELSALAGEMTNWEIAEYLEISVRTVENHISNALRKTGTTSRAVLCELVRKTAGRGR
ncbi:helix-turn-helix domain-containing protein [Arthrobacter sp. 9V]|uniref:helix-turn-helix domain-containing protein n=1 Tax=Arthrobacter sp. 9V TaxID=2653132 RepID=UPI0019165131|nr:helix-turn-helix transcriptional regulator [Arthrobacter sp. 9V]